MRPMALWPMRKPLAIFAVLLVTVVVLWSMWRGQDIPTNVKDLVQWFAGLVMAAYFASSTTEAVKGVQDTINIKSKKDSASTAVVKKAEKEDVTTETEDRKEY